MNRQTKNAYDTIIMDHIDLNMEGKKVLIVNLVFLAIMFAEKNKVTFVTDVVEAKELFEHSVIGNGEFGCDDSCVFIDGINKAGNACTKEGQANWLNWFKENKMKFDVAIMNPPYDRNLHLKILEQIIPYADKVINISPVRWLQDPFAPYRSSSDYHKFEDTISKKIETLDLISAKKASELFDAKFVMNLAIYVCGNGGYQYQHNDALITKIVEKTMQHSWSPYSMQNFYRNGGVVTKPYVLENGCFGGSASIGFDILMCQSYETQCEFAVKDYQIKHYISGKMKGACHFEFDTEEERKNFYNCYTHPFMKWTYHLWKEDVNIRDYKVPYFDDYSHPWDYADFFAWFDLTEEEQGRVMQEITEMQNE